MRLMREASIHFLLLKDAGQMLVVTSFLSPASMLGHDSAPAMGFLGNAELFPLCPSQETHKIIELLRLVLWGFARYQSWFCNTAGSSAA